MCIAFQIDVKTVICTDNLSVIQTVLNPLSYNWDNVNKIRDMLISNADLLKILWIPGHTNIPGNEKTDQATNNASHAAKLMVDITEKKLILKNGIQLIYKAIK